MLSLSDIEKRLQKAKYEPALGLRLVRLSSMDVSGKKITLIAVCLDPKKQLIPHLHEIDGEICIPLTEGIITLGKARKDKKGNYKTDSDQKILVKWDKPQKLIPGKTVEINPAVAHHLLAPGKKSLTVLFILPESHLGEDRKYTTYPTL